MARKITNRYEYWFLLKNGRAVWVHKTTCNILVGHFHKFEFSYPREVFVAQVGCFEDQTPFMRKKRIQAMVGGTIVTIHQNEDGIIDRCNVEFIPFYSKNFYRNEVRRIVPDTSWEYQF